MRLYKSQKTNRLLKEKTENDIVRLPDKTEESDIVIIYETTGVLSIIKRFLVGSILLLLFIGSGIGMSIGIGMAISFVMQAIK